MRQELVDKLVTAAQEVCNEGDVMGGATAYSEGRFYSIEATAVDRLKAVVKAISDEAVATIHLLQRGGEEVDRPMIERIVGHPFSDEEWASITRVRA